jgi:Mg/Co/Ni transporter MgtE
VLLATVITDAVVSRLAQTSVLTEQLRRAGILVSHEYEADTLTAIPVSTVMTTDPVIVPQDTTVKALMEKINGSDPVFTRHQAMLIVDGDNCLRGIVTRGDLIKALHNGSTDETVLASGTTDLSVA